VPSITLTSKTLGGSGWSSSGIKFKRSDFFDYRSLPLSDNEGGKG